MMPVTSAGAPLVAVDQTGVAWGTVLINHVPYKARGPLAFKGPALLRSCDLSAKHANFRFHHCTLSVTVVTPAPGHFASRVF